MIYDSPAKEVDENSLQSLLRHRKLVIRSVARITDGRRPGLREIGEGSKHMPASETFACDRVFYLVKRCETRAFYPLSLFVSALKQAFSRNNLLVGEHRKSRSTRTPTRPDATRPFSRL